MLHSRPLCEPDAFSADHVTESAGQGRRARLSRDRQTQSTKAHDRSQTLIGRLPAVRSINVTMAPITTPFGFESTAAEVVYGIDLTGKRAIVTGASSGIGIETARALADAGAEVTLAVRDTAAGERIATEIGDRNGGPVHVRPLDLSDKRSIGDFVDNWTGALHILVNNAGVMALRDLELTADGWELQFATNHLGHFALTVGLHEWLADADGARIVSLSSRGHLRSPVVFDDINFSEREYNPWLAYGQSKTANVLFAVEATRRWEGDGIYANAVHPGAIAETNLSRHMDPAELESLRASGAYRFKTVAQGAATSVLVATWPDLEDIGGRYFEDCHEAELLDDVDPADPPMGGVAAYALDPDNARRLWELSERAVKP
jgi:NAD(P)-dependent dehydrogenase (short-subunit alcohol dehydrogenase family)